MSQLNPNELFQRISEDIPQSLHANLFVTGSLAAAYEYQARLEGRAVNTKDADIVVHPAGSSQSCVKIAQRLLEIGWTRADGCYPRKTPTPTDDLRAIRLHPP